MRSFTVNNVRYFAKELDFNFMADYGENMSNTMKSVRSYVAFCGNMPESEAGNQLSQHIMNGGNLNEILEVMSKEIEESGFFPKFRESMETAVAETSETATPKRKAKQ